MVAEEEVVVEKETGILDDENELDRDREIVDSKKPERRKDKKMRRFTKEAAMADKRGVCYLSRVPPHMNPLKLRQILSQYGEIQRIYLVPEAHKNATREQKLALEISAAKRERDFYLSKVDQSRALSSIRDRAKKE
ncbi:Nucleotide-binding, alpha-beta plait [Cinnamomum micranthum f. kanehirae]|uniref:Nucleotide-binding, alpha-beta plait n=1 Tax=Cinnamomum micranthum f. kanehirae TaxID=337451 RepID=A0A3S3P743_9MAGN|nr:Nucleotide-binding, alpha-beta plait [Cinnamomum micranthum f. kanehirae]